jgi:hypothetical protein
VAAEFSDYWRTCPGTGIPVLAATIALRRDSLRLIRIAPCQYPSGVVVLGSVNEGPPS